LYWQHTVANALFKFSGKSVVQSKFLGQTLFLVRYVRIVVF
jgi:hypothetical protein